MPIDMLRILDTTTDLLWDWLGVPAVVLIGLVLAYRSRVMQVRSMPALWRNFRQMFSIHEGPERGIHPLKAFFASVGGCIGIANIVLVCTAVQIGGPGALFWIWVTALLGSLIKYSEVFLGIKHRVVDEEGNYDGGPSYYLQKAVKGSWLPKMVAFFFCVYGVEILQFNIVKSSLVANFGFNEYVTIAGLLFAVLYVGAGGVARVGQICGAIIPVFTVIYVSMGAWVLAHHLHVIPEKLALVVRSAFTGHAAFGGFVGSSLMMTISHGVRWGCYTGDIGVGYAAVLHSESSVAQPAKQAGLTIFEIILDTFIICTTSILLILVTDVWHEPLHESLLVQTALSQYFPYMDWFMPFFLLLLGYSTIISYFAFGLKASHFLGHKWGRTIYFSYALLVLTLFSFVETKYALAIMNLTGGLLLVINVFGIWRLRKELSFDISGSES